MLNLLKNILKNIASYIPLDYFIRASYYPLFKKDFAKSLKVPTFKNREELWDYTIKNYINSKTPITYVEFGVWKGESIKYFASENKNTNSIFIGLDSFEGLPEDWGISMKKGTFNTDGNVPKVNDERIKFVKGWFQVSWDKANLLISDNLESQLFVHYDADIYSSTLFALTKMDSFHKHYYAIFDEFFGEEATALYAYLKSYDAKVEFIAKTDHEGLPNQLLCKIIPKVSELKGYK